MKKRTLNELIGAAHLRGANRTGYCELHGSLDADGRCPTCTRLGVRMKTIEELIDASSLGTPEVKAMAESVPDQVVEQIIARANALEDPFITRLRPTVGPEIDALFMRRIVEFAVTLECTGYPSEFTLLLDIFQALRGLRSQYNGDPLPLLDPIEHIQRHAAAASQRARWAYRSERVMPYEVREMQERAATLYRLVRVRIALQAELVGL